MSASEAEVFIPLTRMDDGISYFTVFTAALSWEVALYSFFHSLVVFLSSHSLDSPV